MTADEAEAVRIRLTATQAQRLRELGANPLVLDGVFTDAGTRDAALKQLEDGLVRDGRRRLQEMRAGHRATQLVEVETSLRTALTGAGFVQVVTPLIITTEALAKMGIEHVHPLR